MTSKKWHLKSLQYPFESVLSARRKRFPRVIREYFLLSPRDRILNIFLPLGYVFFAAPQRCLRKRLFGQCNRGTECPQSNKKFPPRDFSAMLGNRNLFFHRHRLNIQSRFLRVRLNECF